MCGCEPSYVCSKCGGTPLDPNYQADAWPTPAEEREQWLNDSQFKGDWTPEANR